VHAQEADSRDAGIQQTVDRLALAYEQTRMQDFRQILSDRLPGKGAWLDRLQHDFYAFRDIRLYYRVERKAAGADAEVWDIYCKRSALDTQGTQVSAAAVISLRFEKEGGEWRVTGIREERV
jgi:hypothetical protein